LISIFENDDGERACVGSLSGWERVRRIDPLARKWDSARIISQLPVTMHGAGVAGVLREVALVFGCIYPQLNYGRLVVIDDDGKHLCQPGNKYHIAGGVGVAARTVCTSLQRQARLAVHRGWVIHLVE